MARKFRKFRMEMGEKTDVPLWSRCHADGGRLRGDLSPPYLIVLDFDDTTIPMGECCTRLEALGVAHFAHTTWSHDPDDPLDTQRYRIVCDVLAPDWKTVDGITKELEVLLKIPMDPCSYHQICWYIPAVQEGSGRSIGFIDRTDVPTTWEPDPDGWDELDVRGEESMPAADRDPDTVDVEELISALEAIDNVEYSTWIRVCMALHASGL
jgi:hypothetical protein